MKYFLDTEFAEGGRGKPITLISIGIVSSTGKTFYAISSEFNPDDCNDWVTEHVLAKLDGRRQTVDEIATDIRNFIGDDTNPQFWGYYADYDWVVFCQIFGRMIDLPKGWPMFCNDIKQLAMERGNPKIQKQDEESEHNALNDARWNKTAYEFLMATRII